MLLVRPRARRRPVGSRRQCRRPLVASRPTSRAASRRRVRGSQRTSTGCAFGLRSRTNARSFDALGLPTALAWRPATLTDEWTSTTSARAPGFGALKGSVARWSTWPGHRTVGASLPIRINSFGFAKPRRGNLCSCTTPPFRGGPVSPGRPTALRSRSATVKVPSASCARRPGRPCFRVNFWAARRIFWSGRVTLPP